MVTTESANKIWQPAPQGSPSGIVITLDAVVDLESTTLLDEEFAAAASSGAPQVTLDMSRIQLIDAAAIATVLRGIDNLRSSGADVEVRYPSPMALQLFEMCCLLQIVGIQFALNPHALLDDRPPTRTETGSREHSAR